MIILKFIWANRAPGRNEPIDCVYSTPGNTSHKPEDPFLVEEFLTPDEIRIQFDDKSKHLEGSLFEEVDFPSAAVPLGNGDCSHLNFLTLKQKKGWYLQFC